MILPSLDTTERRCRISLPVPTKNSVGRLVSCAGHPRLARVEVMQAANLRNFHDPTHCWRLNRTTDWRVLLENRELVTKREDLCLQRATGSKTGGYQSEKGDEKRAHRGSHHDLTNDPKLCVFGPDGVFG